MKVTSTKSIHFSGFNWGINAGQEKELPESKEAQEVILRHPRIIKVEKAGSEKSTTEGTSTKKTASEEVDNSISSQ